MIALLEGELYSKSADQAVIKIGGVGYQVSIPLSTFCRLPDPLAPVTLHIHTHMQSESLQLYGFSTREEKQTFLKLLTIPRVGPRMALNILSGISPEELLQALAGGDIKRLARIPGLGRKSAERILVELKDKLQPADSPPLAVMPPSQRLFEDALSALLNLGYSNNVAEEALRTVQAQGQIETIEDLLRRSLSRLAQR
jgi:holliday junction DNA helicase RuvA